jgi:TPR repeat protein
MTTYEGDDFTSESTFAAAVQAQSLLSENREAALTQLCELADQGSVLSMLIIGDTFRFQPRNPKDFLNAKCWYSRAIKAGSVCARYRLAEALIITNNNADAATLYLEGIEKGEARSMYWLGQLYYRRMEKYDEGRALLKAAAARGHLTARLMLGSIEIRGRYGISLIPGATIKILSAILLSMIVAHKDPTSGRIY